MRTNPKTILTVALGLALLVSLGGVGYVAVTPQEYPEDAFTEFYVLDATGEADEYPTNLSVDESGTIIVGVTNHEFEEKTYTIVLVLDDNVVDHETLTLDHEQTWEDPFLFSPDDEGEFELEILLYESESPNLQDEPYRSLQLQVTVTE
ncbi:hypothetical protein CV102_22525 [Natronococcus pandeyae]|uniref:DUF1616 domain-containing protein n=1 Tax=Natronococcus pandeyae TaxID=2055836 RepID=A0A8J8Q0S7_9EURY|nr:DUF1616 domain-containing protein [Natronococcus pandeyae]TYL36403.1 hypothetical protein CV102_22525 [Natronococcus pandeyae]